MAKIIRTPTMAKGGITDEERAKMDAHTKMWIARAFRTDPIDPDKIVPAIEGVYAAAGQQKPRVVIVPSPLVMAFAYGAAAAIWHSRSAIDRATATSTATSTDSAIRSATDSATEFATASATRSATEFATRSATDSAIRSATASATATSTDSATEFATDSATASATEFATEFATRSATATSTATSTDSATNSATAFATEFATRSATRSATDRATEFAIDRATATSTATSTDSATDSATASATATSTASATRSATDSATASATDSAIRSAADACRDMAGPFGIQCAKRWSYVYQGGNMWAAWECYLTAARDILGLRLPEHDAYAFWEQAAIHGGFRVMHPKFCMVCDFPEVLRIDERNLPHCVDGPSHRWRDGWALYHWHGVRVPDHWITDRANLRAAEVMSEPNIEVRRAGIEILGWPRIVDALGGRVIEADPDPEVGSVIEVNLPDLPRPARFLRVRCATGRDFALGLPPDLPTAVGYSLPHCAQAWAVQLHPAEWRKPTITA